MEYPDYWWEQIVLAIKSVSYMFLMPLSGVMHFGFDLAIYHFFIGTPEFGLYTGNIVTEFVAAAITAYGFYFAVTESFKVQRRLKEIRDRLSRR